MEISPRFRFLEKNLAGVRTRIEISFLKRSQVRSRRRFSGNPNLKEKCHRKLTKEEQKALEDLRSYDDILIKQAEKGSAVVVMDKERYVAEATRQLGDSAAVSYTHLTLPTIYSV